MKLSVSMWSVVAAVRAGEMDVMQFIDFATTQPVLGVELLDYFWTDEKAEIPVVKQKLADKGLRIAAYSIGNNFFHPEEEVRYKELQDLKHGVDVANELGADTVRVFSGNYLEGYPLEQGMDWIVEGLLAGAAYAEEHGVMLALENHGLLAGRSDQVRDILSFVNSNALGANLDTGNFLLVGQDPTEAALDLADQVVLVHLKDFRDAEPDQTEHVYEGVNGERLTGAVVGEGKVDLESIIAILSDVLYSGWLSLEYEGPDDPLTIGVPQSLAAADILIS